MTRTKSLLVILGSLVAIAGAAFPAVAQKPADGQGAGWQTWLAELDPPGPVSRPAPALTAGYLPHTPDVDRANTTTEFDESGNRDRETLRRCEQRAKGVIASRVVQVETFPTSSRRTCVKFSVAPNEWSESITTYDVTDGFVRIGYPEDAKKPDAPVTCFNVLKVGAKPGDRWGSVPGKTEVDREYKTYGMYKGKPCVVITGEGSYTILVEGFGKVLERSYKKKGDKWLLSTERKYE